MGRRVDFSQQLPASDTASGSEESSDSDKENEDEEQTNPLLLDPTQWKVSVTLFRCAPCDHSGLGTTPVGSRPLQRTRSGQATLQGETRGYPESLYVPRAQVP